MYTVTQTDIPKMNRLGKQVGSRRGWRVHEGEFTLTALPSEQDASWLAQVVNLAIARDTALRSWRYRLGIYRLQAWIEKKWPKKAVNPGPLSPFQEKQDGSSK